MLSYRIKGIMKNRLNSMLIVVTMFMLVGGGPAWGVNGSWTNNAAGNWSGTNNWAAGLYADGVGASAWITNNITAARIITVDTNARTLGTLTVGDADGTFGFTVAASGGAKLIFNNSGATAHLNQTATSKGDTLSLPLALVDSLDVANAASNALSLSGAITGAVAGVRTLSNAGSGDVAISGAISNGAGVVAVVQNSGTSLLTLSGVNAFTGGLFVKSGTVKALISTNAFGAAANLITLGDSGGSANAMLNGGFAGVYPNPISIASGNSGLAVISNSAVSGYSGPVVLNSHDLVIAHYFTAAPLLFSGGMTGSGNLTLYPYGGITLTNVNIAGTITDAGYNSGSYAVARLVGTIGSNVTALIEASTSSAMTVSGILTVNSNATALVNSNPSGVQVLTLASNVTGRGHLVISNNSAIADGVALSGAFINHTGTIVNAGTGPGNAFIGSVIGAGVTAVVQASSHSVLTLTGANTYTGGLFIKSGTVKAANINAGGANTGLITIGDTTGSAGATLLLTVWSTYLTPIVVAPSNSGAATIVSSNNVAIAGPVTLNDHDLTLYVADIVSGSGLTLSGGVSGKGTLTLMAEVNRAITTQTLPLNHAGAIIHASLGSGLVTIGGGVGSNVTAVSETSATSSLLIATAALIVNSNGTTLANNSTGSALLTLSGGVKGAGDLILRNNSAITGGVTLLTGAITNIGKVVNSGSGAGNTLVSAVIGAGVTRVVQNSAASALTLSGANTYAGGTTVDNGQLRVAAATGSATGSGEVTINSNGVLTGTGLVGGAVVINSGGTLAGAETVGGVATLNAGGRIAPGADGTAGGTLAVSNLTWNGGGVFHCEIDSIAEDASGAGVHYDRLVVSNTLTAVPAGTNLVIRLDSLGQALAFQPDRNYSLKLISCGTAATLNPADVTLETNLFLVGGTWTVTNMSKAIWVIYRGAPAKNFWVGSGNWSTATNWSLGHAPLAGEEVEFDWNSPANCAANAVSNNLQSLTLASGYTGTVTFATNAVAGGMSLVLAGDLAVREGALAFAGDATAVGAGSTSTPYGVGYTVTAVNVSISGGARLHSDNKGFAVNTGPGKAASRAWGPSYGGQGGVQTLTNGIPPGRYGTVAGPTALGSGGTAEPGAGAIKLVVSSTVVINGRLSADSVGPTVNNTSGSGGSLWLTGGTLSGAGVISASSLQTDGTAAGGGGRIDLSGMVQAFAGSIQALGGFTNGSTARGLTGSILLPASDIAAFTPASSIAFGNSLAFGTVVVTNGVVLTLDANTNENQFSFSALTIATNGTVALQGNGPIVNAGAGGSYSNPYGMGVTLAATNLTIDAGGLMTADGQGFGPGAGPGGELLRDNGGASYGGLGGWGGYTNGHLTSTYGALSNVVALGSGGSAGRGGGAMKVLVPGTLAVNGRISCSGTISLVNQASGSGGSIWIDCGTLAGSGVIAANGGPEERGAGGGGRVHLAFDAKDAVNPVDANRVQAYGGGAAVIYKGAAGTVLLADRGAGAVAGTLIVANDAITTNGMMTLLPTNTDCFAGSPPRVALDSVLIRNAGMLRLPAGKTLAVAQVFSNGASFFADTNSTVALVGTNASAVYGSQAFENFQVEGPGTVVFEAGRTNTVNRSLSLRNATLRSTADDAWWYLTCSTGAVQAVRTVRVKDGNAGGGATIVVRGSSPSANLGHNVNWQFMGAGSVMMVR